MQKLKDKIAIITGAASGIGLATVRLFAEHGARIVASDIVSDLEDKMKSFGDQVVSLNGDCGTEADVIEMTQKALSHFGGLDIAFANGGISGGFNGLFDQSVADWQEILRVNLIGPYLMMKYAAPHMKSAGGGSIIATASVAGLRSGAGGAAYSASKAGVINLVQNAACQFNDANIRVNAICPGFIETNMTAPIIAIAEAKGKRDQMAKFIPLRRTGQAEEIAKAALFLASEDSSYVNGQYLLVDGGMAATYPFRKQDFGQLTM
jgi:NAD(P)-dependent dehydrogenase (short-subunit alcohol dehydrogenase family)